MEIRVKGATVKNRKPYGKERDQRPSQRDNDLVSGPLSRDETLTCQGKRVNTPLSRERNTLPVLG